MGTHRRTASRSNPHLTWGARLLVGAVLATTLGAAQANLNNPRCGERKRGSELAYDACMQMLEGGSSNPVTGNNGGGSNVPAADPIKPQRPPGFTPPVKIPGARPADDSGRAGNAVYPGQRVPKPAGPAARACKADAIKRRCKADAACIVRVQRDCADIAQ